MFHLLFLPLQGCHVSSVVFASSRMSCLLRDFTYYVNKFIYLLAVVQ